MCATNAIASTGNGNSLIDQTNKTKNAALGTVKDGAEGSKGIWDKVKNFAAKIGGAIKNFLFATANFLKNNGVRIGTSMGIAVGVLAIVGCVVSLPVSLPLLAGIAGTIFVVGAIGKLIKNIPEAEGAADVIKKTFQDIKHDVIMGAKRTIKYITSPKTVYTDIAEGIVNNEKSIRGYKSNISALKDILDYSEADLGTKNHTKIGELKQRMETFRGKIQGSQKPENPLNDPLEKERQDILNTLKELYADRKNFEHVETRTTLIPFENILENLIEKFESDSFMNTLRKAPKAS